jgi:hypothetical protein
LSVSPFNDLISGIRKTIQAVRKRKLPIKVKMSWLLKLAARKKKAQRIKITQPAS